MEEDKRTEQEGEDLPRPVPESGLPAGGSSIVGGKAPPGSPATEDVRQHVAGGPAEETVGPVAPDDKYGSKQGASAAMDDSEEDDTTHE